MMLQIELKRTHLSNHHVFHSCQQLWLMFAAQRNQGLTDLTLEHR